MIDEILADLAAQNFGRALIRLWRWAERTENGAQVLSSWLPLVAKDHEQSVSRLIAKFDQGCASERADLNRPLALISALDTRLADDTLGPWSTGLSPILNEGECTYTLVRRGIPPRPSTPADRQNPNLEHWFRHFRVIPSTVSLGGAHIDVKLTRLGDVAPPGKAGSMSSAYVHLSHFEDGVALSVIEDVERKSFHAVGLSDPVVRAVSLRKEFDVACNLPAQFWVAPELTVPADLRGDVAQWLIDLPGHALRPMLSVPGSFHDEQSDGQHVNHADVLDRAGQVVASHNKLTLFSYKDPQGNALSEKITACRRIELLVTPLGIVGVAICKDFSDATSILVHTAWNLLAPDWLLVPSMGDEVATIKLHRERAEEHWKHRGMRTAVANQEPHIDGMPRPTSAPGFQYPSPDDSDSGRPKLMRLK